VDGREPEFNPGRVRADGIDMRHLATPGDLLRQKELERKELERPRERARVAEREIAAARLRYWELLEEFVAAAHELKIEPRRCDSPVYPWFVQRVSWVEGYRLTSGAVVSAPPLEFCTVERRRMVGGGRQVHEVAELSLFVVATEIEPGAGIGPIEQQTRTGGTWPLLFRLDKTNECLTALRRELEASLLILMD
jgi:hypothetical protein